MCLRRTSLGHSKLAATHESIWLSLSAEEKRQYNWTLEQAKSTMDVIVSTSQRAQKFTKLFTVILRLRMLCNHGTYLERASSSSSGLDTSRSLSSALQMGNNIGCDICHDQESYDLIKELDVCPSCARLLRSDLSPTDTASEAPPHKRLKLSSSRPENKLIDEPALAPTLLPLVSTLHDVSIDRYPTKLRAVAKNLSDHDSSSKRSFHETLRKTLTFTDWYAVSYFHAGPRHWTFLLVFSTSITSAMFVLTALSAIRSVPTASQHFKKTRRSLRCS